MPKVSVIMPVYNALPYLKEAIKSITEQTFEDWELLIIDDGSTDGGIDLAREYERTDSRIKLFINDSGIKGPGPARNIGIDRAQSEYVALMDADDISLPHRLGVQVAFMDAHPEVIMSSCATKLFGEQKGVIRHFRSDIVIKSIILFIGLTMCACHAIIFRRAIVKERYPMRIMDVAEDIPFTTKIALRYRVANLPDILYRYRITSNSRVRSADAADSYSTYKYLFKELLPLRLGFIPTPDQIEAHLHWMGILPRTKKMSQQFVWLTYVIMQGNYKWSERSILFLACISCIIRRIILSIFKNFPKRQYA